MMLEVELESTLVVYDDYDVSIYVWSNACMLQNANIKFRQLSPQFRFIYAKLIDSFPYFPKYY